MIDTKNLLWVDLSDAKDIPKSVQVWLDDNQSLTAKLKRKFDNFAVKVLSQKEEKSHANESEILNCSAKTIIREVELIGNNQAVVFARSVIPITSDTQDLLVIGSSPLGEILFNNLDVKRNKIQISYTQNIWARRSLFSIGKTNLLVSEFFLEALYA